MREDMYPPPDAFLWFTLNQSDETSIVFVSFKILLLAIKRYVLGISLLWQI